MNAKLKNLILKIVKGSESDPHFNFKKLKYLIFNIEFDYYRDYGKPMLNLIYRKNKEIDIYLKKGKKEILLDEQLLKTIGVEFSID